MGYKIFVSYKFKDIDVAGLPGNPYTRVRDYVDYIEDYILGPSDHIYKGEGSDEDLSDKSDYYIWEHLKDKIYDSTITIVLISPNMKEPGRWQSSQWMPREIAYSLRETPRSDRTSHNNAILAVKLPDIYGSYSYYDVDNLFPILRDNIRNGYIYVVDWDDFKKYTDVDISLAFDHRKETPSYKIVKTL